jgi:hypothetical protein
MRKFTATLFVAAAMAFSADLTGWISDASCGASNANSSAASRECAKNCIQNGAAPVFVTEGENKVYKISGKADVKAHLDGKVKVAGDVKGDTITIRAIRKAE